VSTIECGVAGGEKWHGICAVGTKLYCAPCNASSVLVIDADTDTVSTIECGVAGEQKWGGICAVGTKLYCAPRNASSVLVIDTETDTVSTIECGVAGEEKWYGICAVGTKLYCAPASASSVLVIDTETDTVSTIECGVAGGAKWNGICAVGTKLYFAPCNAAHVLTYADEWTRAADTTAGTAHAEAAAEGEALNDNAKGGIDRFGYRAYAEGLCDVLKKGEPPLCVGIYAKWGSGKSFMIYLIKMGFDPMAREDKHTHELTQWFEDGYDKLTPAVSDTAAAKESMEVARREHEKKNKRERQRDGQYSNWYCLEMLPRRIWMCLALTGATITTAPMPPQLVPLWVNTLRTVCIEEFTDVWQAVDEWLWRFAPCEMKYLHRCCRTSRSGSGSGGRFTPKVLRRILMLAVVWAAVGTAIAARYMPDNVRDEANRVSKTPHWWLMAIAAACTLLAVLVSIMVQVATSAKTSYSKVASSETQDAATPEPQRKEYVFVDFNAWEFAGSDELWTGLIRNMYDKVEERLAKERHAGDKAKDSEWKVRWRVKKAIKLLKKKYNVRAYAMLLVSLILTTVVTVVLEACGLTNVVNAMRSASHHVWELVVGVVAFIAAAVPTAGFALQSHRDASTSRGSAIFEQAKAVKDHLGFMSQVKGELQELFEFLFEFQQETKTQLVIVAFVDDLDRCLEGRNVKVLEAMQLILSVPGAPVIAFLAIDSRIVVASIEESFGEVFHGAYISGWEYLDKIVQLPFSLPAPPATKVKLLVDSCLDSGSSKPKAVAALVRSLVRHLKEKRLDRGDQGVARSIKCGVAGVSKWAGICAVGTKLYCAPRNASSVLVIDADTDTVSTIECGVAVAGGGKWFGICAVGTKLYCAPHNASSVLVIDADTDTVSTMECGVAGEGKWHGICAVGTKLYCAPWNASSVLVIDAETDTVSTIECGVVGEQKWGGICAVGTKLYCAPYCASLVLVIDAETDTVSTIECGVAGGGKWEGICAVGTKLYFAPCNASSVLVIDADTDRVSTIECGVTGVDNSFGICAVGTKLYCAPCHASSVLVIDAKTDTVSTIECGRCSDSPWCGEGTSHYTHS
jgi:DNA-binding beta-propeller fold protein YncE